jgi:hypothetical protein
MADGFWYTLQEISLAVKAPEASVSARLRDLRKPPFNLIVERRRRSAGTHEYRVAAAPASAPRAFAQQVPEPPL